MLFPFFHHSLAQTCMIPLGYSFSRFQSTRSIKEVPPRIAPGRANIPLALCTCSPLLPSKSLTRVRILDLRSLILGILCSKDPWSGLSAKHERQGVRRLKNKFAWFSSSDSLLVLSRSSPSCPSCLSKQCEDPVYGAQLNSRLERDYSTGVNPVKMNALPSGEAHRLCSGQAGGEVFNNFKS